MSLWRRKFVETTNFELPNGKKIEVIFYSKKNDFLIGQATFGIMINKELFMEFEENTRKCILTHEYYHTTPFGKIIIGLHLILIFSFFYILINTLMGAQSLSSLLILPIFYILSFLLFGAIHWISEFYAEYGVIREMGINNFLDYIDDLLKHKKKKSFLVKLFITYISPPKPLLKSLAIKLFKNK